MEIADFSDIYILPYLTHQQHFGYSLARGNNINFVILASHLIVQ